MTDEEKKAIEQFKNFIFTYQDVIEDEYSDYEEKECAKEYQEVSEKIINLIKKQSKEIEELKEELDRQINVRMINEEYLEKNFISKEKIKEKVEEIKKYKDLARDSIEERIVIADRDSLNYGRKEAHEKDIKVLQSLLEKE